MKTVLIVEDDKNIADLIKLYCEKEGFRAITALDGEEGLELAKKTNPSCIILDLMLPGLNGMEILKKVRENSNVPIIILTAKEEEVEKILGLEMGADDYVTKPFSPKEVMARIKAVMRRVDAKPALEAKLVVGDLEIDAEKFEVIANGNSVQLSALEFKLLHRLASSPGRVFSREQLMKNIYESDSKIVFDRTIDVHVKNLRKKLEDDPKDPKYIESIFGIGYKFKEQ